VAQQNGQQLDLVVAHHVATAVLHAQMVVPVPNVKLDTKAMEVEDVDYALLEHTLLLAVSVSLALAANGQLLEVILVQIV